MFKKLLLLLPLVALFSTGAKAQFRYTFTDTAMPYVPLPANATSVNGDTAWNYYGSYAIRMPFAWSIDSAAPKSVFNLYIGLFGVFEDPYAASLTGFTMALSLFVDRGYEDTAVNKVSRSPIRYLTTGVAPNRIFKVELANVGFWIEYYYYGTLDDYTDQQIWIYEGSSIVEMHYGPSKVTYFNKYFDIGETGNVSLNIGFFKDADYSGSPGATGSFYYLGGPSSSISVKSVMFREDPTGGLEAWPANGQVYRFTPKVKPAGITDLATLGDIKVYPNPAATSLHVEGISASTKAILYSMLGQPVLQTVIDGNQTLDIALLPAGVYKLVLTNKEGVSGATTIVKE